VGNPSGGGSQVRLIRVEGKYDKWDYSLREKSIDECIIEVNALLVDGIILPTERNDSRPRQRKAVRPRSLTQR
jgi:hypothetical protein